MRLCPPAQVRKEFESIRSRTLWNLKPRGDCSLPRKIVAMVLILRRFLPEELTTSIGLRIRYSLQITGKKRSSRLIVSLYPLLRLKVTSMGTMKNVLTRLAATVAVCLMGTTSAFAADFEKLTCSSIPNTRQKTYNVQVSCTATVARPGSAKWYSAAGQYCPNFCTSVGGYNAPSPDGFSCVSGEVRGSSAIGVVNFSPTGCWHDCGRPEGRTGSVSVGSRCYSPGQKRDNDRTDTTLGCYCLTGDTSTKPIEVGIYASGSAAVSAVSSRLSGWESVDRSVRNDKPGRMFDVIGIVPLGDSATIDMVLNIQGTCGTSVQMSGTIAQPNRKLERSGAVSIPLPACVPQCSDGIDNDADGAVDYPADAACSSADDNDENDFKTQCQDGIDNDGDGVSDLLDPGCANNQDNNEGDKTTQCQDKIDNDGDGAIDYPNDYSCSTPQDNDEANPRSQCQNGIDDDGDGVVDLLDPGCAGNQDNNEGDKTTQCQDRIDNDGDGAVDYPADAGCQSATDNNEGDFKAQCQDGIDNDGDGTMDYPNDPGCSNLQDNDEFNQVVLKITPIAECVDVNQNGTLVAHFGYQNDAASAVEVAIGQRNYLSPGAVDRGQPKTFFTGRINNVFTVTFPSTDTITWGVGDATSSANIATERCQGTTLGCVDTDNTSTLSSLDGTARLQRRNIRMLGRKVLAIKSTGPSAEKAESYRELAKSLYLEQWSDIWGSFPKVSRNCSACAAVDMSYEITGINARAQRMYRLARQTAALLKEARRGRLRGDEQELLNDSSDLYDRFVQHSQSLPRFESKCN